MLISEIVSLMPGIKDFKIESDVPVKGAVLDSRLVKKGSLFFCVSGEISDGNKFASAALSLGASAVIMDGEAEYAGISGNKFLVENTLFSMRELGKRRYELSRACKVAVTGSFGKTGTKEMLKLVLGSIGGVYATEGNKNNMLGVTLTGCGMDESDFAVVEMGSNAPGEIEALSRAVKPDIAVITSVGHAHAGRLGGLKGAAAEKLSVVYGLKPGGILIAPYYLKDGFPAGDYKAFTFGQSEKADIYARDIVHHGFYVTFRVNGSDILYRINHPYSHMAEGALAAIAAARLLGADEKDVSAALEGFSPLKGRGSMERAGNLTIIDDTYNAGLESVEKAAESLSSMPVEPKYAVFGEIGEIEGYEEEVYKKIASLADRYPSVTFYLCGESYGKIPVSGNRLIFTDRGKALEAVKEIKSGVVAVKASRSKRFEEFLEAVKGSAGGTDAL